MVKRLLSVVLFLLVSVSPVTKALDLNTAQLFENNLLPRTKIEQYKHKLIVTTSAELYAAVKFANASGSTAISVQPGSYRLPNTLVLKGSNIAIIGLGNSPFDVELSGNGMKATKGVDNLIYMTGNNILLENFLMQQAGNHLVQIASEFGGDNAKFRNLVFQDAYEQLLKVSFNKTKRNNDAKYGLVESCLFRYTAGIGPNWYIGGIDAHGIKFWQIKNNVFDSIASPVKQIAEHAIHLWNYTETNLVNNNVILNSDRGIGLGMRNGKPLPVGYSNLAGQIENNIIIHTANEHKFADVGIIIEDSPETIVKGNLIYIETSYPNAIESRFEASSDSIILGNVTNKSVINRDGADTTFLGNKRVSSAEMKELITKKLIIN